MIRVYWSGTPSVGKRSTFVFPSLRHNIAMRRAVGLLASDQDAYFVIRRTYAYHLLYRAERLAQS